MAKQRSWLSRFSGSRNAWIVGAGLASAAFALYVPVLGSQFLQYDDGIYVLDNPFLRKLDIGGILSLFTTGYFRSYTPLTLISHALDLAVWGTDPFGHHLTSMFLHSVNVLLLFLLFLRLRSMAGHHGGDRRSTVNLLPSLEIEPIVAGAAILLLFAWHPLRVEAVAWISDRKDLLMSLFLFSSLLCYLAFRSSRAKPDSMMLYYVSLALFAAAILSKSTAISYPLVLFLFELAFFAKMKRERARVRELVPFLVVGFLGATAAFLAGTGYRNPESIARLNGVQQALLPFYSLGFYSWKTIVPLSLTPFYAPAPVPGYFTLSAAGLVLAILCILSGVWKRGGFLLAVGSAFCLLLPTMIGAIATSGIQPWADRYTYVASAGVFLAVSIWLANWLSGVSGKARFAMQAVVGVTGIVVLTVSAYLSLRQMEVWRDSMSLWSHVVRMSPTVPKGFNNMGALLAGEGALTDAVPFYQRALALNPSYAEAWNNLGLAYGRLGLRDSAIQAHKKAIEADSNYIDAYTSYGTLLLGAGLFDEAISLYRMALHFDSGSAKAWYNLGIASYRKGNYREALGSLRRAAELEPMSPRPFLSIGVVLSDMDSLRAAEAAFQDAARRGSDEARELLRERGLGW